MKSSGYILIILMVGLCFAIVGSVVNDFETQYPDIEVNTSWESDYDYTSEINDSISGLKDKFDIISCMSCHNPEYHSTTKSGRMKNCCIHFIKANKIEYNFK